MRRFEICWWKRSEILLGFLKGMDVLSIPCTCRLLVGLCCRHFHGPWKWRQTTGNQETMRARNAGWNRPFKVQIDSSLRKFVDNAFFTAHIMSNETLFCLELSTFIRRIIHKLNVSDRSFAGNTKQKRSTTKEGPTKGKTRKGKMCLINSSLYQ